MKLIVNCPYCCGEDFIIPEISNNNKQITYVRCTQCGSDIKVGGVEFEISFDE